MRKSLCAVLIGCLLTLAACGFGVNFWQKEDFSFYDDAGKPAAAADTETFYITLAEGQRTHRGVALGDDAVKALKKYRLTDFSYEICLNGRVEEEQNAACHQKASTAEKLTAYLTELSDDRLEVYLYCDIYKTSDGLKTVSQLGQNNEAELAYSFSLRVKRQKISEVNAECNLGQLDGYAKDAE